MNTLKSNLVNLLFLQSLYSFAQESLIVESTRIDWKDYPELHQNSEGTILITEFEVLDSVEMFEIRYRSDSLLIQAFVALPKTEGTYPVIIYNRGGNRNFGALSLLRESYHHSVIDHFTRLAAKGFVVLGCNYRGSGRSEGMDEFGGRDVNDVLNLIEVVKEFPKADTARIGMYGWSRGGMMTYLALIESRKVKAAVVGGAPTDLTHIDRPEMESKVYSELIPNYSTNKQIELTKRSILFRVNELPTDVPILILHGSADWRVNVTNSTKLASELNKNGRPHEIKIFEGGDHSLSAYQNEVDEEVVKWFNKYLKE